MRIIFVGVCNFNIYKKPRPAILCLFFFHLSLQEQHCFDEQFLLHLPKKKLFLEVLMVFFAEGFDDLWAFSFVVFSAKECLENFIIFSSSFSGVAGGFLFEISISYSLVIPFCYLNFLFYY